MDGIDARRAPDEWHTAFAAALADPDDTLPFMPQPQTFHDQTITQWLRLRRGGTRLRLVLSNEFGREPLVLDAVTAGGASGEPRQPVLLGGHARWEIPPGEFAVSDPVPLPTVAGAELAVAFDSGDGVHLNDAGARALADTVDLSVVF